MDGICNKHGEGEKSPPKFYLENLSRAQEDNIEIDIKWCDGVDWIYLNVRDHEAGKCLHQVSDCKLPNDCAPLIKYVIGTAYGCLIPCMTYCSNLKVDVIRSSEMSIGYYASHIHIKLCQDSQDRHNILKKRVNGTRH
jgi:hypothetical protein